MKRLYPFVGLFCAGIFASTLAGCGSGGGSSPALPVSAPPSLSSNTPPKVQEIVPQPSDVNGNIAVDSTGNVYFGVGEGLDRYSNGAFTLTAPSIPQGLESAGTGIVGILRGDNVVWVENASEPNSYDNFPIMECGGSGGTATQCPEPVVPEMTSFLQDAQGTFWSGGGTYPPGDTVFQVNAQGAGVPYDAPLNSPFGQLGKIVLGPNGTVWGSGIGFDTAALAEFKLTNSNIQETTVATLPGTHAMNDFVYGPDGRFWFTDETNNAIDAVTPAGALTTYGIPTANSTPYHITIGADGALWFTEKTGNNIGRIDVSGHITEYAIRTANSQPTGIAATPSSCGTKAIWFVESGARQLGEIVLNT